MEVRMESPEVSETKKRIRILTRSIFNSRNENERRPYRFQLQREERKLESLKWEERNNSWQE
jgi:hypothetical protein